MLKRILAPGLLVAALFGTPVPGAGQLTGDGEARELVHDMLETLGGVGVWREARTIRIELEGLLANEPHPWLETYWIDLEVPRGRYEIAAGESERIIAWTAAGGWESRDGTVEPQSDERHELEQGYWARELTVIFRRLAAETPATRVEVDTLDTGLPRIEVADARSGEVLAALTLNTRAEPVAWSASIGESSFDRVLGPLVDYGGLMLPLWGASPSGLWRYRHIAASLSPEPPPVSFDPPGRDP